MNKNFYISKYFLLRFLLFLIIFAIPFQDFILKKTILGQFGTNLSMPVINIIFIVILLKKINNLKINISLFLLICFVMLYSFILLLFSPIYVKHINMLVKLIKNIFFYTQPFIVFYMFYYFFKKDKRLILFSLHISFFVYIFLFLYTFFYYIYGVSFDNFILIHAIPNSNLRFRLFSQESSMGVTVYITYGLLSLLAFRNKIIKFLILISLLFGIWVFQSKGAFIVLLVIFFFLIFNSVKRFVFSLIIVLLLILLIKLYFPDIITFVQTYFYKKINGFEEYTSFTTRLYLIIASIISLFKYPFGTGFGTYIYYFDNNILIVMKYLNKMLINLGLYPNTSEIQTYLYVARDYSTKSMLFNLIMMFGIIGLYFFYKFFILIYQKIKRSNLLLKILFFYLTLSQIFFVDSLYLYNFWFAYAIIYSYNFINYK